MQANGNATQWPDGYPGWIDGHVTADTPRTFACNFLRTRIDNVSETARFQRFKSKDGRFIAGISCDFSGAAPVTEHYTRSVGITPDQNGCNAH